MSTNIKINFSIFNYYFNINMVTKGNYKSIIGFILLLLVYFVVSFFLHL